ncbi:MAG: hypothetical protein AAF558_06055 [Verrucomicrobiota bacterium]
MIAKVALVFLLCFVCSGDLYASGTYRYVPPKPPTKNKPPIDKELYAQGRSLFSQKIKPKGPASPALIRSQESRLRNIQSKLPKSIASRVNLPSMSSSLSPTEMAALEYYVVTRYKINLY